MRSPWLRLLTVLATAASLVAVTAPAALAKPDEIAYRCELDVCLIDPDNPGAITNLTDNGATSADGAPSWSPNGSKVAFVSNFGGKGIDNIFVMQPGAAGEGINLATQLTDYPVDSALTHLVWSPDGTRVAFERTYGGKGVFVVAADGTSAQPTTISAEGSRPSFSADGGKIAFSKAEQIYLASSNGSGLPVSVASGNASEPVLSPDGTKIAFDVEHEPGPFVDLHIIPAGGGAPVKVADNSQWSFAAWSPDGTKIAYRATTSGETAYIRVVNSDGTQDHGLAALAGHNIYEPSWSPDGFRVVVQGFDGTGTEAYVASTDGSGSLRPITTGGDSHEPVWRPDPLRTPQVPGVTPATPPLPGVAKKPKIVWITKRIHWTPGLDPNLKIGSYGCGGLTCAVVTEGQARSVSGPPIVFRPAAVSTARAKPKHDKKAPKPIVVGSGRMTIPAGATRPLKLKLNSKGIGLLKKQGKLTIAVTVTTTGPGRPKTVEKKTVRVVYDKPAKRKPKR